MEYSEDLLREYLTRHFMRSVSERYALLISAGISIHLLAQLKLDGSPSIDAPYFIHFLKQYSKEEALKTFFEKIVKIPLPDGIPVPTH